MAISGSLTFLSASLTGSANINVDFVGLNTLIIDPISSSTNVLGQPASTRPEIYYNSRVQAQNISPEPNYFNSLLLHRNGPYQHPSWKQYRGGEHPVARTLRLNNTMSIDATYTDAVMREDEKKFLRYRLENETHKEVDDYFNIANEQLKNSAVTNPKLYRNAALQRYYEPSVLKAHKPFIYDVQGNFKVRSTLMNQMVFFENKEINQAMNIAGPDRYTSSFSGVATKRPKQEYYDFISVAKENGATGFIYSETIFPRSINAFRPYKLEKNSYEEINGSALPGLNSYNNDDNRSFWKDSQPDLASNIDDGRVDGSLTNAVGTTRARHQQVALNSQGIIQKVKNDDDVRVEGRLNLISDNGGLGATSLDWNFAYNFMTPGIILHSAVDTTTGTFGTTPPSGAFVTLEAYQPYAPALLSMWPLDPRPDIYSSPVYLTSSIGGKGLQIGVTPHRMKERSDHTVGLTYTQTNSPIFSGSADTSRGSPGSVAGGGQPNGGSSGTAYSVHTTTTGSTGQHLNIMTGSAGELVYSTKPTMFFHKTGSEANDIKGYRIQTASLQYNRHTFPYNTPFYATNRIRDRNPFYNSYSDFAQDMKYFGRDYSFVPDYKISNNLQHYYENLFSNTDLDQKVYSLTEENKFVRAIHLPSTKKPKEFKLNFLTLDGAFITASADVTSLSGSSESTLAYKYVPLSKGTLTSTLKNELGYSEDTSAISYSQNISSVKFNESLSHTDMGEVSNLLTKPFVNTVNTVPTRIKFIAQGLKKLRPEKNFYPVTKTVEVGSKFKQFVYNALDLSIEPEHGDGKTHDRIEQAAQINGKLQTLLEPFFAPGILYNSIKSGIAVDYPVYDSAPTYFAPWLFFSGSLNDAGTKLNRDSHTYTRPNNEDRLTTKITSSFNYGGFYMLGASRCIPAILNTPPTFRMPFEALYDTRHLINRFSISDRGQSRKLHLTTDFLDLDINYPTIQASNSGSATYLIGGDPGPGTAKEHPGAAHTLTGPVARLDADRIKPVNKFLYESSINNFLCETMNFFLKDQDNIRGAKLPIIMSDHKQDSDISLDADKFYGMELSLKMGRDQILCEGPRSAGISGIDRSVDNIYTRNATMRGYIFGPPAEIVRMTGSITRIYSETLNFDGTITRTEPLIASDIDGVSLASTSASYTGAGDYESYFGANLQDPAYQSYTPPYFYGKSSMVLAAQGSRVSLDTWTELFNETDKDSYYLESYVTGGVWSGTGTDLSPLCVAPPGSGSMSGFYSTRMKIDRSIDVFQRVQIQYNMAGANEKQDASIWCINPKWVCPVLDFSSSYTAVTENERQGPLRKLSETVSYVTNSFHDATTGRGLWGGYGIDPYDSTVVNEVAKLDGNRNLDKGITLSLGDIVDTNKDITNLAATYDTNALNATSGFKILKPSSSDSNLSGSLIEQLGFDKQINKKIGQISDAKKVSEALMIVPYFDKPIEVRSDEEEVFVTREIIPGKYFLPIQNKVFENILSMAVTEKHNEGDIPEGLFGFGDTSYKNTSVYKMINMLMDDDSRDHAGYELPAEFDFINYNILPFQAIVIPFEHELKKQELMDIYQGIMPESSLAFEKVTSALELELDTTSPGAGTPWLPDGLDGFNPGNFLDPSYITSGLVNQGCNNWIGSSREFYKNLKFMIFKVKQRGNKSYKNYKNKQIHKSVFNKVSGDKNITNLKIKGFDTDKTLRDVFGYNWPYDDFSLVETFKLDIQVEVQE